MRFIKSFFSLFSKNEIVQKEPDTEKEEPVLKTFPIDTSWLIPVEPGQAVSSDGWTYTEGAPTSVTWHWTATWDRNACDELLGGSEALRKPQWNEETESWEGGASAHYCIGRSYKEGISQYVRLEYRSWHAGAGQSLRWDGKKINYDGWLSGSRASIGIETVEVGYARGGVEKESDWIEVYSPDGMKKMWIEPWTDEQIDLMIFVGKQIIKKYPNIGYKDHHGHMDICPSYKDDPSFAFPFSKVLSGIYERQIADVWTPFLLVEPRQKALQMLGYSIGSAGADGLWGISSISALKAFQRDHDLHDNGYWSTAVCWAIFEEFKKKGLSLNQI